jgi:hypothetical protein
MPAQTPPDFESWFSDAELRPCPRCKKQTLIAQRPDQPLAVCLSCGVLETPAPAPSA